MREINRLNVTGIVFDVNETLSDMAPMAEAFHAVGAPPTLAKTWFAGVLRDGFALATVGETTDFIEIAKDHLMAALGAVPLNRPIDQAASSILEHLKKLSLHPDVAEGVHSLARAGLRLMTLSNGSTAIAEKLLTNGGIHDEFSMLLSVEGASLWKPARAAYEVAFTASGLSSQELLLVAVHPWDIHGAHRAGMRTAWINRDSDTYPSYFASPDLVVRSISDLSDALRARN